MLIPFPPLLVSVVIYKPQPEPTLVPLLPRSPSPPLPIAADPLSSEPPTADPLLLPAEPVPPNKSAFDLTDSEKHELRKRKRRRLALPVAVPALPLPSPPRSPTPPLSTRDASPEPPHPSPRPLTPIHIDSDPSPGPQLIAPQQPPSSPQQPSSQTPFTSTSDPNLLLRSFFSTEPASSSPQGLFQLFNLPSDDPHFSPTDPAFLLDATALHLGRALGGFSRLLTLQTLLKDQSETIAHLHSDLHLLRHDHLNLRADHSSLQTQLEINTNHQATLEAYLLDQTTQNEQLRTQLTNQTAELAPLRQQSADQINQINDLQQTVAGLGDQIKQRDEALHQSAEVCRRLEEANFLLETQRQTVNEDSRNEIIEDYKRSQELTDAVVSQYDKGYSYAKGLIRNSGQNPKDLGFSSDDEGDAS